MNREKAWQMTLKGYVGFFVEESLNACNRVLFLPVGYVYSPRNVQTARNVVGGRKSSLMKVKRVWVEA